MKEKTVTFYKCIPIRYKLVINGYLFYDGYAKVYNVIHDRKNEKFGDVRYVFSDDSKIRAVRGIDLRKFFLNTETELITDKSIKAKLLLMGL